MRTLSSTCSTPTPGYLVSSSEQARAPRHWGNFLQGISRPKRASSCSSSSTFPASYTMQPTSVRCTPSQPTSRPSPHASTSSIPSTASWSKTPTFAPVASPFAPPQSPCSAAASTWSELTRQRRCRGMIAAHEDIRFVTYLSPSIPQALFEALADHAHRALGHERVSLRVELQASGPQKGGECFSFAEEADVAFMCAPSFIWLRDV